MRIDEPGDDAASARVDARRVLLHVHGVSETDEVSDVGDASSEGSDDAVLERGNFSLCEPAARRGSGAGGNQVGVFDEEVRLKHAEVA